jgi:short-subunit dehydrogenase
MQMSISYFADCTALVTGASAGIGREFARQLAPVVHTLVLVARRDDRLKALELELKIINPKLEVFCRQVDLGNRSELERFCGWLDESDLAIDLLINNAGLGDYGFFIDSEWDRIQAMLDVNITALTYLTYRILPRMRRSGCGAILNVSSVAGLFPVPRVAVYAATKAYVNSLSEALRAELRNSNISVTTLCPGPTPTEFSEVARRATGEPAAGGPDFLTVPVQEVVHQGLMAVSRDRARVIPGTALNLIMTAVAFLPMFVLRLLLNIRAGRPTPIPQETSFDYETSSTGR